VLKEKPRFRVICVGILHRSKKGSLPDQARSTFPSLYYILQKALYKYLQADEDKYRTAEDARLVGKARSCSFADGKTDKADQKGYSADYKAGDERLVEGIMRICNADRERVDARRNPLKQQRRDADVLAGAGIALAFVREAFVYHFAADEAQKQKRDPRNAFFERLKIGRDGVDADPADQGHRELEKRENACNKSHLASLHAGLVQAVGERNRKGVHRKPDAERYA
jgi:hypothetical protein